MLPRMKGIAHVTFIREFVWFRDWVRTSPLLVVHADDMLGLALSELIVSPVKNIDTDGVCAGQLLLSSCMYLSIHPPSIS